MGRNAAKTSIFSGAGCPTTDSDLTPIGAGQGKSNRAGEEYILPTIHSCQFHGRPPSSSFVIRYPSFGTEGIEEDAARLSSHRPSRLTNDQ